MTSRKQVIIELLDHANGGPLTSAQLAAEINVSSKTIRNDIKKLNTQLQTYNIMIESERGKGFILNMKNKDDLKDYFQSRGEKKSKAIPVTSNERVSFLLEKLLLNSDYVKIEDLHHELYVSRSTLQGDLTTVRQTLKKYGLSIEQKPHYGIKVSGEERLIRFCISEYLFNQIPLSLEEQWLSILSQEELDIIRNSILKNLRKYHILISDISLHNLLTHLTIAYTRINEKNPVQLVKRDLYKIKEEKEFTVAKEIVRDIERQLDVHFPQNEIAYLSIHLQGTKLTSSLNVEDDDNGMERVIDPEIYTMAVEIVERIDSLYGLHLSGDQQLLINLCLHLKPAITRYHYHMNIRNPMLEEIKLNFPLSFEAAFTGAEVIYDRFNFQVNEDEVAYIALHIEVAQEKAKSVFSNRKKCLIVCASGLGSAQLLLYKIKNEFGDRIQVIGTTEYYNLDKKNLENVDFIISTIPIKQSLNVPVIHVSTILGDHDVSTIERSLEQPGNRLEKHITPKYTFLNRNFKSSDTVIRFLTERLINDGQAGKNYTESVLERERQAPTSFGNRVALPHPLEAGTDETFVSLLTLTKPIKWGGKDVQLVFLINVDKNDKTGVKPMFQSLIRLIDNKQAVDNLLKCNSFSQIEKVIKTL